MFLLFCPPCSAITNKRLEFVSDSSSVSNVHADRFVSLETAAVTFRLLRLHGNQQRAVLALCVVTLITVITENNELLRREWRLILMHAVSMVTSST